MKFSIKDFFSKCEQIRRKPRIWSHLLKKPLMEKFIFRAVGAACCLLKSFVVEIVWIKAFLCNNAGSGRSLYVNTFRNHRTRWSTLRCAMWYLSYNDLFESDYNESNCNETKDIYIKLCNSLDKTESEETCIFNPSAFRQSNNKW